MTIRVQSVPAGHPYVQRLRSRAVELLPDPGVPGAVNGQWWPHPALEAAWIDENFERFDVLHVHFGTESRSVAQLADLVEALGRRRRPLVYTVHDLEHPHLADPTAHDEQIELLARSAAMVVTLTEGAAREIRRRFGIEAKVIAHPQIVPDHWFATADQLRLGRLPGGPRFGVHLRALRANIAPTVGTARLARAAAQAGGVLHVFVNEEPNGSAPATSALPGLCAELSDLPAAEVHVRPRPSDDELYHELAGLDVAVLPYSHGTHSGWLEMCWDLGVRVVIPASGYYAEQHRDPWFAIRGLDVLPSLSADVARSELPPVAPAAQRLVFRQRQLREVGAAQLGVYQAAVGANDGLVLNGPKAAAID